MTTGVIVLLVIVLLVVLLAFRMPVWLALATSGAMATRRSPCAVSLMTPILTAMKPPNCARPMVAAGCLPAQGGVGGAGNGPWRVSWTHVTPCIERLPA